MACTLQSYHDTREKAQAEVKRWRGIGFPARYESRGMHYYVLVGSFGDRYHKMKRKRG